jgi:hypothetical protein
MIDIVSAWQGDWDDSFNKMFKITFKVELASLIPVTV